MNKKELYSLYLEIHKRICEFLEINVEPAEDIILSNKNTCDENYIYLDKRTLEIKDEKTKLIKLVGVIAHEDTHYILRKLIPLYNELYDRWYELKAKFGEAVEYLAIFDELVPTVVEFIIRLDYTKDMNYPKEKIIAKYEEFAKELLGNLNERNLGYFLGTLIALRTKDEEKLKEIAKALIK